MRFRYSICCLSTGSGFECKFTPFCLLLLRKVYTLTTVPLGVESVHSNPDYIVPLDVESVHSNPDYIVLLDVESVHSKLDYIVPRVWRVYTLTKIARYNWAWKVYTLTEGVQSVYCVIKPYSSKKIPQRNLKHLFNICIVLMISCID